MLSTSPFLHVMCCQVSSQGCYCSTSLGNQHETTCAGIKAMHLAQQQVSAEAEAEVSKMVVKGFYLGRDKLPLLLDASTASAPYQYKHQQKQK